jgi:hypothetical protein
VEYKEYTLGIAAKSPQSRFFLAGRGLVAYSPTHYIKRGNHPRR